jgi:2,3-bisphosphoglycerate-independent phosphoglycerate mutase
MRSQRRGLLIILDGLGDQPVSALGGRTPLEAASTPNLDQLVARGRCGLVDPGIPGLPASTHSGIGTLLGVDPGDMRRLARGPVEAAGIGLTMGDGDVAMRCNFATLERSGGVLRVLDRRAGRIESDTQAFASLLQNVVLGDDVSASLYPATQHRAVLCLSGPGLSGAISDTDPGERTKLPAPVAVSQPRQCDDEAALRTAEALNRFVSEAFERLDAHPLNQARRASHRLPANGIISRQAGTSTNVASLLQRTGVNTAIVAGECTLIGMARLLHHTVFTDPRFNSLPDTDLRAKVGAVRTALASHDLVVLHIKGTDICSHDKDPEAKRLLLERIDAAIAPLLGEDLVIAVTGDHSTDSNTGVHIDNPVPSLLFTDGGQADGCVVFGESQSAHGGLGRISGTTFLSSLLQAMGCTPAIEAGIQGKTCS